MAEYRALGTVISFTAATDIALTFTLTGTGSATLNSTDSPYLQIAANTTWRFPDLCQYICAKVREWIFNAVTADAGITKTSFVETDFTVRLTFTPALTVNGALLSLSVSYTGGAHLKIGGTTVTLNTFTLTNSNGLWSKLGLCYEANASRLAFASTNTVTFSGLFQPRSIWTFLRSEIDEGNTEEPSVYKVARFADGTGSVYESGQHTVRRELRLVDLDETIAGRDIPVATLSSISAGRADLNLPTPDEASFLSGISGLYGQADLLSAQAGAYVSIGGAWVVRFFSGDATQISLCEKIPSSITPPTSCPITIISELHALWYEALRTGHLIVYDMVESVGSSFGLPRWTSQSYMLSDQSPRWKAERRSVTDGVYSFTFSLIRRDAPGITITTET